MMSNKIKALTTKVFYLALALTIIIGITILSGCSNIFSGSTVTGGGAGAKQANLSPEEFLKKYDLKVKPDPLMLKVKVPASWKVKSGDYPEGLYWNLANEFSMDAGLDITHLKGTAVEAWKYILADGLPGQGEQSKFTYDSDVILLVDSQKVVGAWLAFNRWTIGPSVNKRYLEDITGLGFSEWVEKKGLFSDMGINRDLVKLDPVGLLKAFFKAVTDGDKKRAYCCMDPQELLESLTVNKQVNCLYNPGFGQNNSMVENIVKAVPKSFNVADVMNHYKEISKVTDQKALEVTVTLNIQWRDDAFNTPEGDAIRFTNMRKYKTGWKLWGLGTGP